MKEVLRVTGAFILMLPTVAGAIGGFLMLYGSIEAPWGMVSGALVGGLLIVASYFVFITAYRKGSIEVMTAVHATSELDHLPPTASSDIQTFEAANWATQWQQNALKLKGGALEIFGDEMGPNISFDRLRWVVFDAEKHQLLLLDTSGWALAIYHPKQLWYTDTYLKVMKANKVEIMRYDGPVTAPDLFAPRLTYTYQKGKIRTVNAFPEIGHHFSTSRSAPSVLLLGSF
ncbi:MAG: hypothetical protein ACFB10_08845 [Salibacteraceae bacterium]